MASEAAAVVEVGALVAAMYAEATGTAMKIEEGIGDYNQEIQNILARSGETSAEAARRRASATEEGVMGLKETGAQAAFNARMATTKAELAASSEEAKLGSSGVRATGSPLLHAQQNVDLAFAAADRTVEAGRHAVKYGGVQLKNRLGDISAQETLATAEFGRREAELTRKRDELRKNKGAYVTIAAAGGAGALASSYARNADTYGWFS